MSGIIKRRLSKYFLLEILETKKEEELTQHN